MMIIVNCLGISVKEGTGTESDSGGVVILSFNLYTFIPCRKLLLQ